MEASDSVAAQHSARLREVESDVQPRVRTLRAEADELGAEAEALRAEVEVLRRKLGEAERHHEDGSAPSDSELAGLVKELQAEVSDLLKAVFTKEPTVLERQAVSSMLSLSVR